MGKRINMATRKELLDAIKNRYQGESRGEKSRILDEFVAVTGYHLKHALRLLNQADDQPGKPAGRIGRRIYDEAVRTALIIAYRRPTPREPCPRYQRDWRLGLGRSTLSEKREPLMNGPGPRLCSLKAGWRVSACRWTGNGSIKQVIEARSGDGNLVWIRDSAYWVTFLKPCSDPITSGDLTRKRPRFW